MCMYYTERKLKNKLNKQKKNWGGLGTRLVYLCVNLCMSQTYGGWWPGRRLSTGTNLVIGIACGIASDKSLICNVASCSA